MKAPKPIYDNDEKGMFLYYENFKFIIQRIQNNEDAEMWTANRYAVMEEFNLTKEISRICCDLEDDFNSQDEITQEFLELMTLKYFGANNA